MLLNELRKRQELRKGKLEDYTYNSLSFHKSTWMMKMIMRITSCAKINQVYPGPC